jgi:hypothetical protein
MLNEGLGDVLKLFSNWSKNEEINLKKLYASVRRVDKIKPSAHRLLSILFQIYMSENIGDQEHIIFKAILTVIEKL